MPKLHKATKDRLYWQAWALFEEKQQLEMQKTLQVVRGSPTRCLLQSIEAEHRN
jgi:hypothetical protein